MPLLYGLGSILALFLEILVKIFVKSRLFRLATSLLMMEAMYLLLDNGIQFLLNLLASHITDFSVHPSVCYVFSTLGIMDIFSFYVSVLISMTFIKFFLRMSERLI